MIFKRKSELIGDLIRQYLRKEGLETPLNEFRMQGAWEQVMGNDIARYTGKVYVKNGVLYVHIKSPALKANLMMGRDALVPRLNQHVGAHVIEHIVFI